MTKWINNLRIALRFPRWRWALLIAVASDIVGIALALSPPAFWVVDGVTVILLLVVIGFRWPLFISLAVEAVPFLQLFPFWTLVVLAMAGIENQKPPQGNK